jgi:hypothetical protein
MDIIRVFPERNSYTPDDDLVFVGFPPLWIPKHDEVHISCTFTWDMDYCEQLAIAWEAATDKPVKLGGVAFGDAGGEFVPGKYVKQGVTFTSRGCNNNCPWCFVRQREGKITESPIVPGNIIQDNNFLQTSRRHQTKVFEMLKTQRQIEFRGGLENSLITPWFAERCAELQQEHRLKALWLAVDTDAALDSFAKAMATLKEAGVIANHNNIMVYALSYGTDLDKDEQRMKAIFDLGGMPRCQLYRAPTRNKTRYPREVEVWARQFQRPALTKAILGGNRSTWT